MSSPYIPLRSFGWNKDPFDIRDYAYANVLKAIPQKPIPKTFEVPGFKQIPKKDQDGVGACVAFSGTNLVDYYNSKERQAQVLTSPEFIYDEGRKQEGSYPKDNGMYIRTGCQLLQKLGVPLNSVCPWDPSEYNNITLCDSQPVLANAALQKIKTYASCHNINDVISAIANSSPIWLGVPVYSNWPMDTSTGIIPAPKGKVIGGHAIACYAYDQNYVKFRNSWDGWGLNGDGFIPRSYIDKFLRNNQADAWTIVDVVATKLAVLFNA